MEREIRILRQGDGAGATYSTFVEGLTREPMSLTNDQVLPVFVTIYGDSAKTLKGAVDGEVGVLKERRTLTTHQERTLQGLFAAYEVQIRK